MAGEGIDTLFNYPLPQGVRRDPLNPRTWVVTEGHAMNRDGHVPTAAQMPEYVVQQTGIPAQIFYSNPTAFVNAFCAVAAYHKVDYIEPTAELYNFEAEALGQTLIYGENSMPTIDTRTPLIAEFADIEKLRPPGDWLSKGRVRYSFELQRLFREVGIVAGFCAAPFTLAVALRGYAKVIRDLRKEPAFAHEMFARLADEVLPSYLRAFHEYTGLAMVNANDAWSAFPNLTPDLMREWVLPYAARLTRNCASFGLTATVTVTGDYVVDPARGFDKDMFFDCLDVQRELLEGIPVYALLMGKTQDYPLDLLVEYLHAHRDAGRAVLLMGLEAGLLRDGPAERIVDTVRRFVDVLGRDNTLTIYLAGVPADTPPSHVDAAISAIHAYGSYPIAGDLSTIRLDPSERESFAEYARAMSDGEGLTY
jgi:uroporphyrinogen-III decarboxylase